MNNLYDEVRTKEIENFLKEMYYIQQNEKSTGSNIDESIVYHRLKNYGLKNNDVDQYKNGVNVRPMFEQWINRYKNNPNINVYFDESWKAFCQFAHGISHNEDEFLKLYIPIDKEHLYDGVNTLFDFIAENNINHLSKVSRTVRSDNVIVRLKPNDVVSASKIIDFVNTNEYLKNAKNITNPFVPSIDGIGYMKESGISYNYELSEIISKYIIDKKSVSEISIDDFSIYVRKSQAIQEVKDIFENAVIKDLENQKELPQEIIKYDEQGKRKLFLEGLRATYVKYGPEQVEMALLNVLRGNNYNYFTNGDGVVKYRKEFSKYLPPKEIYKYIDEILVNRLGEDRVPENLKDKIHSVVGCLYSQNNTIKFNDICKVTLEKYGIEHLKGAILEYLTIGSTSMFCRYPASGDTRINYRRELNKMNKDDIKRMINNEVENMGIDPLSISQFDVSSLYSEFINSRKAIL